MEIDANIPKARDRRRSLMMELRNSNFQRSIRNLARVSPEVQNSLLEQLNPDDRGGHECHSISFQSAASVVDRAAGDDDRRASERRHVFVTRAIMGELLNRLNLNIDRVS